MGQKSSKAPKTASPPATPSQPDDTTPSRPCSPVNTCTTKCPTLQSKHSHSCKPNPNGIQETAVRVKADGLLHDVFHAWTSTKEYVGSIYSSAEQVRYNEDRRKIKERAKHHLERRGGEVYLKY